MDVWHKDKVVNSIKVVSLILWKRAIFSDEKVKEKTLEAVRVKSHLRYFDEGSVIHKKTNLSNGY